MVEHRREGAERSGRVPRELGAQGTLAELLAALKHTEPVVYRSNGNRTASPRRVLRRLEALMPAIGVTRVAEISHLSFNAFPTFQSTRPSLWAHPDIGQNTGAQGKGFDATQAKISAMMESVEGYCAEPRMAHLIRGTFRYLSHHHAIMDPRRFTRCLDQAEPTPDEPLMWTPAAELQLGTQVLIPAETVFFPFLPHDYATRAQFPATSNGLAAGSTYLEAVLHGLYEVIERHVVGMWEDGEAEPRPLELGELPRLRQAPVLRALEGSALSLFALLVGVRAPPVLGCILAVDGNGFAGFGCAGDIDTAADRALSEALQAVAVRYSAAREDISRHVAPAPNAPRVQAPRPPRPRGAPWTRRQLRQRVWDRRFRDLRSEYRALLGWCEQAGLPQVCVANLTRRHVDLPVVKVVVPGARTRFDLRQPAGAWRSEGILRRRFAYGREWAER